MARSPIETDLIYHVYNRGVEKRDIYIDDGDRLRFIHYLYHCNDISPTPNLTFHLNKPSFLETQPDQLIVQKKSRSPLVDIFVFTLMPNHFHLMLRERVEGGISMFMQRIGTGYTMFFNEKYERSGVLFQGKFKYKPVLSDSQLLCLSHYIHLNPLPLVNVSNLDGNPEADLGGRTSLVHKLLAYRWSSLRDYAGHRNFPSVVSNSLLVGMFGSKQAYMKDLKSTINESDLSHSIIEDIAIDISEDHLGGPTS